jgi:hypothetical protein
MNKKINKILKKEYNALVYLHLGKAPSPIAIF